MIRPILFGLNTPANHQTSPIKGYIFRNFAVKKAFTGKIPRRLQKSSEIVVDGDFNANIQEYTQHPQDQLLVFHGTPVIAVL